MSLTNEQIIEAIASKSVSEIVELISAMEEKFGVSAAAAVAAAPAAGAAAGPLSARPGRRAATRPGQRRCGRTRPPHLRPAG